MNLKSAIGYTLITLFFSACANTPKVVGDGKSASRDRILASNGHQRGDELDPEQLMEGDPVRANIPKVVPVASVTKKRNSKREWRRMSGPRITSKEMPNLVVSEDEDVVADSSEQIAIHSLNIGAGSCHIIDCPNTDTSMIIDCGSMKPSGRDMRADDVKSYIENVVDGEYILVATHPDRDHVNLVPTVLKNLKPNSVWLGGSIKDYRGTVAAYLDDLHLAEVPIYHGWEPGFANRGSPVKELQCGTATSYILTVNIGESKNSKSLVLLTEYGNFRAIFTGDAHGETERAVVSSFGALTKDVTLLTASHHGAKSHESNHNEWSEHVNPKIVIYSSGTSHGHPNTGVVSRYSDDVEDVSDNHAFWSASSSRTPYRQYLTDLAQYVTKLDGVVVVTSDGESHHVTCSFDETCF